MAWEWKVPQVHLIQIIISIITTTILIIIGKTTLPYTILPYLIWFSLLWISLQSKVSRLASNPQPGGPRPSIYVPQTPGDPVTPRHQIPFSSPSMTQRAMVEVF
jgi:hypothetical protein